MKTPCYVIDEQKLIKNLEILKSVKDKTGCKILLAQKAFSCYHVYPLIASYLDGAAASGLYEARLGYEMMKKENHVYSPAYRKDEIEEIIDYSDHIVFNSTHQIELYQDLVLAKGKSIGLRINPEISTQTEHAIYDPCAVGSRLGATLSSINESLLENVDGFHFHTLCEQNSDDLKITLDEVEAKFGKYMHKLKWINFGGGHHITRDDYDIDLLVDCINHIKETYDVQVYLEPGEAIALNAGYLYTEVLELVENGKHIAIVDTSAACHMPDVIEMPYTPPLQGAKKPGENQYDYLLGGPTCLSGDIIGEYSFDHQLKIGEILRFNDMAIYTMVKNNTFNGMKLPNIYLQKEDELVLLKEFGYEDFKCRL